MRKKVSVLKEFGFEGLKVRETVAQEPTILKGGRRTGFPSDLFCLRIDADEYNKEAFEAYYPVFERYAGCITIFFNGNSFRTATDQILRCKATGLDVQSHSFYHYIYSDYESNRRNVAKARDFFSRLGIDTVGFAAPMGWWNHGLMKALEDEGYAYSSDFSYDYMSLPSYPRLGEVTSRVLEIPVFPVAPELFWEGNEPDVGAVFEYYKQAIDEMVRCGVPVIIYAHTSTGLSAIPGLLGAICRYALERKQLRPATMTGIYEEWTKKGMQWFAAISGEREVPAVPEEFIGREVKVPFFKSLKESIKKRIDFEKITPYEELECALPKKVIKLLARKLT